MITALLIGGAILTGILAAMSANSDGDTSPPPRPPAPTPPASGTHGKTWHPPTTPARRSSPRGPRRFRIDPHGEINE